VNGLRRLALSRRVLVNLTTGRAFRGVLFETRRDLIVLRNAELLEEDQVVPVEGSVVIERARIEFVQVIGS
jgi:small nuclear ribonucleoprotein (snRNP)-like protein